MNILTIIGIGLVAAIMCLVLRQYRPEYAMLLSLATGVFIFLALLSDITEITSGIQNLLGETPMPTAYMGILLKALGICFLTQIACDACKDAGESAISSKIEIAGKVAVLLISLPLFEQVLSIVSSLMG